MALKHWFRRRPSDDEMREELEAHVALRAEHDDVDDASARRRLGNALRTRERMRRVWVAEWWDTLGQDARFTLRSWRRKPGFALGAILVLALGLGASTSLFAALDRVLFRPLPYSAPDRLVSVGLLDAAPGSFLERTEAMIDKGYVQVWNTTPPPFEAVTALNTATCDIAEEQPEQVRCGAVESNFLRVLGVQVGVGRDFLPEDDVRGATPAALISHGLWVRRYGADQSVLGRTLSLESGTRPVQRVPIVGVLPPDFEMPVEEADILLPLQLRPLDPDLPFSTFITTLARLRPEVTPGQAELMLASQLPAMLELMPSNPQATWRVRPLRDRRVGDAAGVAWLLVVVAAAFLLIACVNVAGLLLARVAERHREFGVRAALGAGGGRLARLALAESLLLALAAGGIGLLVSVALLETFVALAPPAIPGIAEASIDLRVFVLAALLVGVSGMAIGLWPAVSVLHAGGLPGLRPKSSSSGTSPRIRFALVSVQVALSLALLGGSGLLVRSLWNVVSVPLGFDGQNVITLTASLSATRYPTSEHVGAFFHELLARAQATPGTVSAALSDAAAPRGRRRGSSNIGIDDQVAEAGARHATIRIREVTPGYFEAFRIPLVSGRTFRESDWGGVPAAILSESAERILFAGARGVGRRVQAPALPDGPWHVVVGVTADIRNGQRVTDEPEPEIYLLAQRGEWGRPPVAALPPSRVGRLVIRTTAGPDDANAFLRRIVADLDPRLPVTIETVDRQVETLTAQPRFIAWLLTAFAALALLLAAAGLNSVASYLVSQRRRDIGVRIALGAAPGDVGRTVVGEAGRWIVGGAGLGCALGWIGTRALQSQLYGVGTLDAWSWIGALVALALALLVAVVWPAYRAAHVDPIAALRAD